MRAGGFGACAALLMQSDEMEGWAAEVRLTRADRFRLIFGFPSRRQYAIVRMKCAFANFYRAGARQSLKTRVI